MVANCCGVTDLINIRPLTLRMIIMWLSLRRVIISQECELMEHSNAKFKYDATTTDGLSPPKHKELR